MKQENFLPCDHTDICTFTGGAVSGEKNRENTENGQFSRENVYEFYPGSPSTAWNEFG